VTIKFKRLCRCLSLLGDYVPHKVQTYTLIKVRKFMAFDGEHKSLHEEKKTDYCLNGKQITVSKKRGRPPKIRNPLFFTQDKKIEACALYCVLGDFKRVAEQAKVPEKELRKWQEEPWWYEVQRKIMVEQNDGLLSKINDTIDLALTSLEDRIINGDCVYLPEKIGNNGNLISEEKTVRVPVKARDLAQIFHAMTHQRQLMRGDPTQISSSTTTTESRLNELQKHFKMFAQGNVIEGEVTEVEDATNV
jgi:hypothetical protein